MNKNRWSSRRRMVGAIGAVIVTLIVIAVAALASRSAPTAATGAASAARPATTAEAAAPINTTPVGGLIAAAGPDFAGSASAGEAQFVSGAGMGSTEPPTLSAERLAQIEHEANERENERDPLTPIDPAAPVRQGPPVVPASNVQDIGKAGPAAVTSVPSDFVFKRNSDLGAGTGSIIPEPSTASALDSVVLQTWNWYAAISKDAGTTWTYYDPDTMFPASYGGFCCDQSAYYDPSRDITVWILQYVPDITGTNGIRIAVAKGSANLANAGFTYWTLTPQQIGSPIGTNYDQPKVARSNNNLYIEATQYGAAGGSVVMRLPLDTLASGGTLIYNVYLPGLFSPGFTQRGYGSMYFAAHVNTSHLRVFEWPEGSNTINTHDIAHTAYPENFPYTCPRTGGSATSDWCQRRSFSGGWAHSDRIFTGWYQGGVVNFMWDASQGNGGFGTFNYPYIHVARVNASTWTLVNEPIMYNPNFAFAYSSAALNDRLDVAGTVIYGGGTDYQTCAVFIWDAYTSTPAPWTLYLARSSDSDPNDKLSGDYLSSRRNGDNGLTWSATCYALVGGGGNVNVHPYYLWFGRWGDFPHLHLPLTLKN